MSETDTPRRAGGLLRGLSLVVDAEDRRVLATAGIWIGAAIVGAASLGLALGLAVRVFAYASGL